MDKSFTNIEVSFFRNVYDVHPQTISLLRWLQGIDKYNPVVDQIRATTDKATRTELKKQLPAITPSGTFTDGRKAEKLTNHSGFIALDFDNLQNPDETKAKISQIANVFYCGLSASGGGLWALIPISNPEHHKEHFLALRLDFLRLGLQIDPACQDVSRLRFYSYDLDSYLNLDAIPYKKRYTPPKPIATTPKRFSKSNPVDPLQIAERMIFEALDGQLHHVLLKASHLLGGYVGGGYISQQQAENVLENAIQKRLIKSYSAAKRTIRKGIEHGKRTPLIYNQN